jgi:hypothetical protein
MSTGSESQDWKAGDVIKLSIEVNDEISARKNAILGLQETKFEGFVQGLRVVKKASGGFLGAGARPGLYEVSVKLKLKGTNGNEDAITEAAIRDGLKQFIQTSSTPNVLDGSKASGVTIAFCQDLLAKPYIDLAVLKDAQELLKKLEPVDKFNLTILRILLEAFVRKNQ